VSRAGAPARNSRPSPHHKQEHLPCHAADQDRGLAPIDLRLGPRLVAERHEYLIDELTQLTTPITHIATRLALGHLDAPLITQPLPHPPGRVALLARRLAVGHKPGIDQRPVLTQLRRRPPLRSRPLPITVPADLLEQLHSRSHPFRGPPPTLDRAPKVEPRSDGGGAKPGVRTGAKSGVRTQSRPHESHFFGLVPAARFATQRARSQVR
jgi:hypothetical protein